MTAVTLRNAADLEVLIDDFDDAMRAGIDKHRAAVDHGVAVVMGAVFRWHVVIGYAVAGQVCAHPQIAIIGVGWMVPFDNVAVEARPLIDTEHTVDAADNT